MPALLAAVHSLRQLLFGHMPAPGAALAGLEFAGRGLNPFATSFQHFVAQQRSEQPRGGVQYFPVQARLLGYLLARFLESASHPVLTPTPESGAVDLVDGLPVVVELRDGFVQPLEQRIQRFPLPANEHGHAVVAVCGCGCACDRVERAQCDVATVSDE